ncbi:MAG: hypothetical protein ACFFF4_04750 [Candidatus Thorarchaeota archaeon]
MEKMRATINLVLKSMLMIFGMLCLSFGIFILPVFILNVSPLDLMTSHNFRCFTSTEFAKQLHIRFGLVDNPDAFDWIYMFWRFLMNVFSGQYGLSLVSARPVFNEILPRLANTLLLVISSTILIFLIVRRNVRCRPTFIRINHKMPEISQFMLGATILTEVAFKWNGIGHYFLVSLVAMDYPVIVGSFITLFILIFITWFLSEALKIVQSPNPKLQKIEQRFS